MKNINHEGYPLYGAVQIVHPIDYLSVGRTLSKFMMDIRKMPEKVEEVMDIITDANIKAMKQAVNRVLSIRWSFGST